MATPSQLCVSVGHHYLAKPPPALVKEPKMAAGVVIFKVLTTHRKQVICAHRAVLHG
jgi:hypothetical protein